MDGTRGCFDTMDRRRSRALLQHADVEDALRTRDDSKKRGKDQQGEFLLLDREETVQQALVKLRQWNVLSAPLVSVAEGGQDYVVVGIVDVVVILQGLVQDLDRNESETNQEGVVRQFFQKKLAELPNWFRDGGFFLVPWNGEGVPSLLEVIQNVFLTKWPPWTNHRAVILNEQGLVGDILTQTDIVRYVYKHVHELGELAETPIKELQLATVWNTPVATLPKSTKAIDAFRLMLKEYMSAYPIVEEVGGPLLGNISTSDLRGFLPEQVKDLELPVIEFLQRHENRALVPITCMEDDSLSVLLSRMVKHRLHRIYIADGRGAPVGVVTMTDILRILV